MPESGCSRSVKSVNVGNDFPKGRSSSSRVPCWISPDSAPLTSISHTWGLAYSRPRDCTFTAQLLRATFEHSQQLRTIGTLRHKI